MHKAFKISNGSGYLILAFKTTMFVSGIGFISIPPINTVQCGGQSKSLCNREAELRAQCGTLC